MHADAVILAGGRASRMGGVDKPAIEIGGRTMLDAALEAVAACERIVVVGPHRADMTANIVQTQEVPRGGGPVAAIGAALRVLDDSADLIVVVAADIPFIGADAVAAVAEECRRTGSDAVFAVDESGRSQYLVGAWRRDYLDERLRSLGSLDNLAMKALLPDRIGTVALQGISDCDTESDVARARASITPGPALELTVARALLRNKLSALPSRPRQLRDAIGATLAEPVRSAVALPRFDISAMDGYAVAGPGPWQLRAEVGYAGGERPALLHPGEAVRIATGAHLPDGSTAVLRDEFADVTGGELTRRPQTPVREDIRRAGEDWPTGHELLPAGAAVTPMAASAAASGEVFEALVRGPVRAHVVVTGDEIRSEGPLRQGQTRDSVGPVVSHFLAWCGIDAAGATHLRDTADGFDTLFASAIECDLIVIVGATGGGAADQLRAALDRAGAKILVERVRCRPGGSQLTAELVDGRTVLGLPGNPFAAISTLLVTAPAIVDGLTARTPLQPVVGSLANASACSGPVSRIVPVTRMPDGTWTADVATRTAHLAGLVGRDGLAIVPPAAADGDLVELNLFP